MTHRLLCVPLAALLAAGCGLDEVDADVTAEETIPGVPVPEGLPLSLSFGALTAVDVREELRENDAELDDIDSARLRSLRLTALDGASFDTFLEEVEFAVTAEGREPVPVARATGPFPPGTRVEARAVLRVDVDVSNFLGL
jgi:hypothetical protein